MYDYPYRVETTRAKEKWAYAIIRTGVGAIVLGHDRVLLQRIVELLNDQEHEKEGR